MLRLKDTDVGPAWGSMFGQRTPQAHVRPARAMLTRRKLSKTCSWKPVRAEQAKDNASIHSEETLADLQMALQEAVKVEDYTLAAQLRDRIRSVNVSPQDPQAVLRQLSEQLAEAIRMENYNEAARRHEELRALDPQIVSGLPTYSNQVTQGVRVQAKSAFLPLQSRPGLYLFSYKIRITNESEHVVQLRNRHWVITDAHGYVDEIKGPGVIGQQPVLEPGHSYVYSSYAQLKTPQGTQHGEFDMQVLTHDGTWGRCFAAAVGTFGLNVNDVVPATDY